MAEKWKCPRCLAPVEDLRYSVSTSGTEYGTAMLSDVNEEDDRITDHEYSDTGDTNWEGDTDYECPHCDKSVDPSELIWIGGEDDVPAEPTPEKPPEPIEAGFEIIKPEKNIIDNDQDVDNPIESSIICKGCFHILVTNQRDIEQTRYQNEHNSDNEFFVECNKCGSINSTVEFRELLKEGFFNQDKKHAYAKRKNHNRSKLIKSKSSK